MQSMQSQLERERQRRIMEDRRVKEEQRKAEEQERERVKAEKRAAKVSRFPPRFKEAAATFRKACPRPTSVAWPV